jgi:hypothetical protein
MGKRLLLVEGKDDMYVVWHLCKARSIPVGFEIKPPVEEEGREPFGDAGVDRLLDQVPVRLKESGLERLAVILDADEDADSRWTALRGRLLHEGYINIPDRPRSEGTIIKFQSDFGEVQLGIWIMPNNQIPGMLEDFLAFLVPESDKMLPRVAAFLEGIPEAERLFSEKRVAKARIHAYLAVQKEPGKPLGLAITFRYLDAEKPVVDPFLNWLQSVLVN